MDNLISILIADPAAVLVQSDSLRQAALLATKEMFDFSLTQEPLSASYLNSYIPIPRTPLDSLWVSSASAAAAASPADDSAAAVWAQLQLKVQGVRLALGQAIAPVLPDDGLSSENEFPDDQSEEGSESEDFLDDDEGQEQEEEEEDEEEEEEQQESSEEDQEPRQNYTVPLKARPRPTRTTPTVQTQGSDEDPLNDDFFNIDEFNTLTEQMEVEEEEQAAQLRLRRKRGQESDEDEEEEEVIDWGLPVGKDEQSEDEDGGDEEEAESEQEEEEEEDNANEIMFDDFFQQPKQMGRRPTQRAPPAKKSAVRFSEHVKVKPIKNRRVSHSSDMEDDEDDDMMDDDDAVEMTEEQLRAAEAEYAQNWKDDDLGEDEGGDEDEDEDQEDFDEDEDEDEEDDFFDDEEEDVSGPEAEERIMERAKQDLFADEAPAENSTLTAHSRRQAKIAAQIRELENENVAPKSWTMSGEAKSKTRPINSLLEEELDFESAAKVAPVITEETTKSLEDMIKQRILASNFDDVQKRLEINTRALLPSRFFELNSEKSEQGLADLYEKDYSEATGKSGGSVDVRDERLRKQHEEVDMLFDKICSKLDALSNANFTPKAPKAEIKTISNLAAVSLESAMPTAMSLSAHLAPEEVLAPSNRPIVDSSELTPAEKKVRRQKARSARKRDSDKLDAVLAAHGKSRSKAGVNSKQSSKDDALKTLLRSGSGVSVVGKQSKQQSNGVALKAGDKRKRDIEAGGNANFLKF